MSDAEGRGIIVPESVLKWLKEAAESNNIPYQLEVGIGGTTDTSAMHLSREGISSGFSVLLQGIFTRRYPYQV